jgi:hypothetical protein
VFKKVFAGLAINSSVYIHKALVWISPYGSIRDHLSMKGNDYGYVRTFSAELLALMLHCYASLFDFEAIKSSQMSVAMV